MAWIHISYGNFTVGLFSDDGDCHKVISGEGLRSRDPRTGDFDEGLDGAGEAPAKGGCGGGSAGSRDLSSMVQQYNRAMTILTLKAVWSVPRDDNEEE